MNEWIIFLSVDNWRATKLLVTAGAKLDASDCHFGTPLHICAMKGYTRSAEILLAGGECIFIEFSNHKHWINWGVLHAEEGRKEMFYLTTHSTHFIYGYMASDIWLGTILIVRKETRCRHMGYSFRLTAKVLLYSPSHRQDSTSHGLCHNSRGALAGMRNSSMGSPHEGSIRRPIAPWANALTTELHLAPSCRDSTSCRWIDLVFSYCLRSHSFTIYPTPYNRKQKCVECVVK